MKLRAYQQAAVDAVYEHLRNRSDNPVAVLPTGAGKSLVLAQIASDAVKQWNGRVLILAHVKELLEQNANKVRRLCPDIKVGLYSAGLKKRDTNTPVLVAGIQSIYKRACDLDPFDLIVVDECFPAGTLISTPRGEIQIEDLYVGQPVFNALGVGVIEAISARNSDQIIELETDDGRTIRCTPNHRFFTEAGWVEARSLAVGASLFSREDVSALRQSIPSESLHTCRRDAEALYVGRRMDRKDVLLAQVRGFGKAEATNHEACTSIGMARGTSPNRIQNMRLLSEQFSSVDQMRSDGECNPLHEPKRLETAAFLFNLLFEDSGKSDVDIRRQAEGDCDAQEDAAWSEGTRWQRHADGTSSSASGKVGTAVAAGVRRCDDRLAAKGFAQTHQTRPCQSRTNDGDRVGRHDTWCTQDSASRQDENFLFASQRVVRITIIECQSPVPVFNLQVAGHPSYYAHGVLTHNCHLISRAGDGMYRQFLADCKVINPNVRVIGLTATPFRLDSGMICSPDHFLNHVCYEIGIKELIRDGYLSPLISKAGVNRADFGGLHVRAGEFVSEEVESLVNNDALVSAACAEIIELTKDCLAVLIFASSVAHGRRVVEVLQQNHGIECGYVTGETPPSERDELLSRFRGDAPTSLIATEPLRFLCNVNVLTTGFDAPRVDCVVMLRPTMSPGLLYQCVGRGFRLHPGKLNCLVLDFGGNIERHGPIDQIKPKDKAKRPDQGPPAKECEQCHALVACGYANCPECGHPFPPPEREPHDAQASDAGVLSGEVTDTQYDVHDIVYRIHRKRDADEDAPRCLRVDYMIGLDHWQSEFVCIEHTGYARRKAEAWWRERCIDPCPTTAEEALDLADAGLIAPTESIVVRSIAGQKYDRIIKQTIGEIADATLDDSEVPF